MGGLLSSASSLPNELEFFRWGHRGTMMTSPKAHLAFRDFVRTWLLRRHDDVKVGPGVNPGSSIHGSPKFRQFLSPHHFPPFAIV